MWHSYWRVVWATQNPSTQCQPSIPFRPWFRALRLSLAAPPPSNPVLVCFIYSLTNKLGLLCVLFLFFSAKEMNATGERGRKRSASVPSNTCLTTCIFLRGCFCILPPQKLNLQIFAKKESRSPSLKTQKEEKSRKSHCRVRTLHLMTGNTERDKPKDTSNLK